MGGPAGCTGANQPLYLPECGEAQQGEGKREGGPLTSLDAGVGGVLREIAQQLRAGGLRRASS
jgi:hypothetical protein